MKKILAITLIASAFVFTGKPVRAENWVPIAQNVDGTEFSIDESHPRPTIWLMMKYATVKQNGVAMDIAKTFVNCRKGTILVNEITGYNENGSWIGPDPTAMDKKIIVTSGSAAEQIYNYVCTR